MGRQAREARLHAEKAERRAQLLADAGAVMDISFDYRENLVRLATLLIRRAADWCVIHLREDHRLNRVAMAQRDPGVRSRLETVFPAEDEIEGYPSARRGMSHLLTPVSADVLQKLFSSGPRAKALGEILSQSLIQVPLRLEDRTVGVLTLGSIDPDRIYSIDDLQTVQWIAQRIVLAIQSSRLYQDAQREIALRKEVEARIRVFNQDLERRVQERTALLEEATREANSFAYTVAHDLRAPLRAITGFCQALQEDYSGTLDANGGEYLRRIVSGARRMDDLIRDLLDYARLNRTEIKRGYVDLDQIVDGVLIQMAGEIEERKAVVRREGSLGRVIGQDAMLTQAFTNLISNALKFVAPGVAPSVRLRAETQQNRIRVYIEDNGIGIAAEHHDRIFGIFERLNRAEEYPGTGIGLAIVRRAAERLGGAVGVESELGKGSRFWIELPSA